MSNLEEIRDGIQKVVGNGFYIPRSSAKKIADSEYQLKALKFLLATNTKLTVEKLGLSKPLWGEKKVNTYEITLKNVRHTYTFTFYDSINNTYETSKGSIGPSCRFYDYLTCLDLDYSRDFDDFCSSYGYTWHNEAEYLQVKLTYLAVKKQDENLRLLFTEKELESLAEIN